MAEKRVEQALKELQLTKQGLYRAGRPGFPSNFTRDGFVYAWLADDKTALRAQIDFAVLHQGRKPDAYTGEEPGKIHHEWPGVDMNGHNTAYSACDTTAWFVIGLVALARHMGRIDDDYRAPLERAVGYIRRHVDNGLFFEDPRWCGAERFALDVTYWKDSQLNGADGDIRYPRAYVLAHFQNMAALRMLGEWSGDEELLLLAQQMWRAGEGLWEHDHWVEVVDGSGEQLDSISSDSLNSLWFIAPQDLRRGQAEQIQRYVRQLETKVGYRTGLPAGQGATAYHTRYVWVWEQALIHAAAARHGLEHVAGVAARIRPALEQVFPELLDPLDDFKPAGNRLQLWSVGAYQYFERVLG